MSTFEEHIRAQWQATYDRCDPAIEGEPRKYAFAWFREGAFYGVKLGTQIGQQVHTDDAKRAWEATWGKGYLQGLSYLKFHISNLSLHRSYDERTFQGAELMQQLVIDLLDGAIDAENVKVAKA